VVFDLQEYGGDMTAGHFASVKEQSTGNASEKRDQLRETEEGGKWKKEKTF